MDTAILYNPNAFLVYNHVVKSPAEIETPATHKMRPISELLLKRVKVTISVYES